MFNYYQTHCSEFLSHFNFKIHLRPWIAHSKGDTFIL
jgi:hypothetical protein